MKEVSSQRLTAQDRTICDGVTAFHAAAECLGPAPSWISMTQIEMARRSLRNSLRRGHAEVIQCLCEAQLA